MIPLFKKHNNLKDYIIKETLDILFEKPLENFQEVFIIIYTLNFELLEEYIKDIQEYILDRNFIKPLKKGDELSIRVEYINNRRIYLQVEIITIPFNVNYLKIDLLKRKIK